MISFAQLDRSRDNNFDFLRLALSILVIFSHCYLLTGADTDPFDRLVHGQAQLGWTAVNFFFAISGYLISSSWLRSRGSLDYLRRRILRIHPGLIVAVFFCFLVAGPLGSDHPGFYFHQSAVYLSLLLPIFIPVTVASAFASNPLPFVINGSLWTIPCEFIMYLLVMLLGAIGICKRRWLVLTLFMVILIAHRSIGRVAPNLASAHVLYFGFVQVMLRLLAYFIAGMTLRAFHDCIPHSTILFIVSLAVMAASYQRGLENFLPIFGVYALFFIAYSRQIHFHQFGKFGDFSYGTYLYAFPIQQLVIRHIDRSMGPRELFAIATPLTLLAAFASWHLVEKPFLSKKGEPTKPLILPDSTPAGA